MAVQDGPPGRDAVDDLPPIGKLEKLALGRDHRQRRLRGPKGCVRVPDHGLVPVEQRGADSRLVPGGDGRNRARGLLDVFHRPDILRRCDADHGDAGGVSRELCFREFVFLADQGQHDRLDGGLAENAQCGKHPPNGPDRRGTNQYDRSIECADQLDLQHLLGERRERAAERLDQQRQLRARQRLENVRDAGHGSTFAASGESGGDRFFESSQRLKDPRTRDQAPDFLRVRFARLNRLPIGKLARECREVKE
jgi:hypothetical protein